MLGSSLYCEDGLIFVRHLQSVCVWGGGGSSVVFLSFLQVFLELD